MRKAKKQESITFETYNDKLPPANKNIESVVLGSLILNNALIDSYIQDLSEDLFFYDSNKVICNGIKSLYQSNVAIDILTLFKFIRKEQPEFEVTNIVNLTQNVASTANFDHHFRILQEEALKRLLITHCSEAVVKSFENNYDVFQLYNETQSKLDHAVKGIMSLKLTSVAPLHKKILEESILVLKHGKLAGIETGLALLDNLTNGWQRSDLIILAGRPSMGKTAAAISMAIHPAVEKNIPVGIFSLEMSSEQLVGRMQSYLSGVNVGKIVKKQLTWDDVNTIEKTASQLTNAPIFIDDTANINLFDLKAKARKMVREHGVQIIFVDYLQLMRSGLKFNSRENEIAEISRGLKAIAKELNIPVIALSQLSRAVETRASTDKKPQLSDLRESGQIEQDADMVIFCYRPEYYGIENYEVGGRDFETKGLFMFLVAKHRNGELGEIPLKFIHTQTKLTNLQDVFSFKKESSNSFEIPKIDSTFVQQNQAATSSPSLKPNFNFFESPDDDNPF